MDSFNFLSSSAIDLTEKMSDVSQLHLFDGNPQVLCSAVRRSVRKSKVETKVNRISHVFDIQCALRDSDTHRRHKLIVEWIGIQFPLNSES